MITDLTSPNLNSRTIEASQREQINLARGAWKEGRANDALLLIETLKGEPMSDRVAAECCVAEAAFLAERGEFNQSLDLLRSAAPFIDAASESVKGAFHHQRARAHKELGRIDEALTDYSGAEAYWQECGEKEKAGAAALNLAGCYLALGDTGLAAENLQRALALFIETNSFYLPQAYDTQAKIFLSEGRLQQAAESICAALNTVSANETWRAGFLATQEQIETRLLHALQVEHFSDWDRVKLYMVRRALRESDGSPARAGVLLGVTRHAIESLVDHHPEVLEPYRKEKRVRRKTIIKKI